MTNSVAEKAARKRERLVAAAADLLYRQGIERTTLAHIAEAADVRLGNVYYYFKTKDEILAAVTEAHVRQLETRFATLERDHSGPKERLVALAGSVAAQGATIARFGCPYGTLGSELVKRADPLAATLMGALVGWAGRQFRALGRADADDLAVEFVAAYQGSAVLASTLGQPELMTRQARRIQEWITTLEER